MTLSSISRAERAGLVLQHEGGPRPGGRPLGLEELRRRQEIRGEGRAPPREGPARGVGTVGRESRAAAGSGGEPH